MFCRFIVSCSFNIGDGTVIVRNSYDVANDPNLNTTTLTFDTTEPGVALDIVDLNGNPVTSATVGDSLQLRISLPNTTGSTG